MDKGNFQKPQKKSVFTEWYSLGCQLWIIFIVIIAIAWWVGSWVH